MSDVTLIERVREIALTINRRNSLPCTVRTSRRRSSNQMVGCLLCSMARIYDFWTSVRCLVWSLVKCSQDGYQAQVPQYPIYLYRYTPSFAIIDVEIFLNKISFPLFLHLFTMRQFYISQRCFIFILKLAFFSILHGFYFLPTPHFCTATVLDSICLFFKFYIEIFVLVYIS